jgi:GTP-binding protein
LTTPKTFFDLLGLGPSHSENERGRSYFMIDEAVFAVKGGNGGDGVVHFRREKYAPRGGPDGGDGGDGGSVYFVSDPNLTTLRFFSGKDRFAARHGQRGGKARKHGENGEDIELRVPVGTVVEVVSGKDESKGVLYADLDTRDMRVCVARGGHGGRGNWYFRSPTNTTPRTAELGTPGEARWLHLASRYWHKSVWSVSQMPGKARFYPF